MVPCVIFEDEHLLVVAKPAGWNTHAPSPYAGEGIYDWLRHREPRWAPLAILHRLDKETSGLLVFGKTPLANRSLTEQFTRHRVRKKYLLLTDRAVPEKACTVKSSLLRLGDKYASRPGGEMAETHFRPSHSKLNPQNLKLFEAEPRTGRTHQIRVHAAESGFPILGDVLYGGTASSRVFLHAAEIGFTHPATNQLFPLFRIPVQFKSPLDRSPERLGAVLFKNKAGPPPLFDVDHRIGQTAGMPHHRHGAVTKGDELAKTARLIQRGHQEDVAPGVDPVSQGVVETPGTKLDPAAPLAGLRQRPQVPLIPAPQNHQIQISGLQARKKLHQQVESLLVNNAGDHPQQGSFTLFQTQFTPKLPLDNPFPRKGSKRVVLGKILISISLV